MKAKTTTRAKTVAQLRRTVRLLEEGQKAVPYTGCDSWHKLGEALAGYLDDLAYEEGRKRECQPHP